MTYKKRRKKRKSSFFKLGLAAERLRSIERLVDEGFLLEARAALADFLSHQPKSEQALGLMLEVAVELQDAALAERAAESLFALRPNDADLIVSVTSVRMLNRRIALALESLHRGLAIAPDHPRLRELYSELPELESAVRDRGLELGFAKEDAAELLALHERVGLHASLGNLDVARTAAEALLARKPDFAPALNNLSLAYGVAGKLVDAIDAANRVLSFAPDNVHALSNLARCLVRSGRIDEAEALLPRLLAAPNDDLDGTLKKLEALALFGDAERSLELYRKAKRAKLLDTDDHTAAALLLHFVGVAALRAGDEKNAEKRWTEALERDPSFELVANNLDDLESPPGDRHAPWPFDIATWISESQIAQLQEGLEGGRRQSEEAFAKKARKFLAAHPEMTALVPILLDRGDPAGRQLAYLLAATAQTPEMLDALETFALGRWGPDSMRFQAVDLLKGAGRLSGEPVEMWIRGKKQTVQLSAMEITDEPTREVSPQVASLMERASAAIHAGDLERARSLCQSALELDPKDSSARYNLAVVLVMEEKDEEYEAALREIHDDDPDYSFARFALARLAVDRGALDEAREWIEPILTRAQLHVSEARMLFEVQMELAFAREDVETAEAILTQYQVIDPDSERTDYWEEQLMILRMADTIGRLLPRRRKP